MNEYCTDCLNLFSTDELEPCICDSFTNSRERTITTKSGVKVITDNKLHCKLCLMTHHKHAGTMFI